MFLFHENNVFSTANCIRDCSGILFLFRFLERDKKRYSGKPDVFWSRFLERDQKTECPNYASLRGTLSSKTSPTMKKTPKNSIEFRMDPVI